MGNEFSFPGPSHRTQAAGRAFLLPSLAECPSSPRPRGAPAPAAHTNSAPLPRPGPAERPPKVTQRPPAPSPAWASCATSPVPRAPRPGLRSATSCSCSEARRGAAGNKAGWPRPGTGRGAGTHRAAACGRRGLAGPRPRAPAAPHPAGGRWAGPAEGSGGRARAAGRIWAAAVPAAGRCSVRSARPGLACAAALGRPPAASVLPPPPPARLLPAPRPHRPPTSASAAPGAPGAARGQGEAPRERERGPLGAALGWPRARATRVTEPRRRSGAPALAWVPRFVGPGASRPSSPDP